MHDTIRMPRVSVVVPVYNVESYLHECIDSLLNQTLKNIEIILINDGSTDNSASICDSYGVKYDNVKVVHQENRGISAARNKGIGIASGTYIGFVDSDDYVAHHMYEHLLSLAETNNADIVKASHYCFNVQTGKTKIRLVSNLGNCIIEGGETALCAYYTHKINVNVWDGLFHSRIFKTILFPDGRIIEDCYFSPKALFQANKICLSEHPVYFYRIRPGSIMSTFSSRRLDAVRSCLDIEKFLAQKGQKDLCLILRTKDKLQRVNIFVRVAALKLYWSKYQMAYKELITIVPRKELFGFLFVRGISKRNILQLAFFLIHPFLVYLIIHSLKGKIFFAKAKRQGSLPG